MQEALVILVLLHTSQFRSFGQGVKYCACRIPLVLKVSESESREVLLGLFRVAEAPSSTGFSVTPSNHSGRPCDRIPSAGSMSSFLSSVRSESCNWSPQCSTACARMLDLGVEPSAVKSCGDDVGDVLAIELEGAVDNPGTTIGT